MALIRRIDELGRLVIPIEYRNQLGIKYTDSLSMELAGSEIIVKKIYVSFELEEFIRRFIVDVYGNKYQDVLVSKTMMKDVYKLLKHYFDKKLVKVRDKK